MVGVFVEKVLPVLEDGSICFTEAINQVPALADRGYKGLGYETYAIMNMLGEYSLAVNGNEDPSVRKARE